MTRSNISSVYDYDQRYRIVDEMVTLDGTPYTTSYEYDSMDRVTKITYPDGTGVNLTYNAQTLLESVEGVIDNIDYNARNQMIRKELSNGVVTTYTYDTERLLLDRIYTEGLQDLNYDFDNVGNILQIQDNVLNSVKTYGYDHLDRLTSASMSVNDEHSYQRDFTYDQYGCIRQVEEDGTLISAYAYALKPFHAPVYYNGYRLTYDDSGNMVDDGLFTYVYNDANQLSEVRHSGNNTLAEKYWYDGNDRRVKKQNSAGEFTYYVNQFYEIDNGTATSYFFRDDERIAKQTAEGMEWYLSDHLGSTTLLVNESGLEVERTEYFPYGQVHSGGLEKYGFTGQENDIDTGLMYYGARYYSPEYRIFIQPDTLLPDPYNPQALNRYAYVLNNPVKYTDPSGHIAFIPIILGLITVHGWYTAGKTTIDYKNGEVSTGRWAFTVVTEVTPLKIFKAAKLTKGVKNVNPAKVKTAGEAAYTSVKEVHRITKKEGTYAAANYVKEKAVSHINQYSTDIILAAVFDFPKRIGSEVLKLHESKNSGSDKGQRQDAAGNSVSSATDSSSSTASSISSSVSKAAISIGSSISSAANIIKTTVRNTLNKLFRK